MSIKKRITGAKSSKISIDKKKKALETLSGMFEGLWKEHAQEYVNKLR